MHPLQKKARIASEALEVTAPCEDGQPCQRLKDCLEVLLGSLLPGPTALSFICTVNSARFSRESCTVSSRIMPPQGFSLMQSPSDPTTFKSAVAAAAGLSMATLASPVQEGGAAPHHLLIDLSCPSASGDQTMWDLITASVRK